MAANDQLVRQWTLLRMLSARRLGLTQREIAGEQGVSEKTVRRDLQTLTLAGFPLTEQTEAHGRIRYTLQFPTDQPPLSFCWDELAALYLGRRFLEPLAGTVFGEAAHSALKKFARASTNRLSPTSKNWQASCTALPSVPATIRRRQRSSML